MRQGIGASLRQQPSNLGSRAIIPVKLKVRAFDKSNNSLLGAVKTVDRQVVLFGPGDVMGFNERVVTKVGPPQFTNNFDATLTPFIDFAEADFLWRYSTRKLNNGNWIPWLTLVVLKVGDGQNEAEFVPLKNENSDLPPRIQIPSTTVLPDLNEAWRWAHVHLLELENSSREQIIRSIKNTPQKAVCRLLCPRKLEPETRYQAFVVPTYRIGLEAALHGQSLTTDRTLLSWGSLDNPSTSLELPFYYQWSFRTGTAGNFEELARKLKGRKLEDMGTRTIDCSNPGYGMLKEGCTMQMEAPLKSIHPSIEALDEGNETNSPPKEEHVKLGELLNSREKDGKLRVSPPVYGEWYAEQPNKEKKVEPTRRDHWLEELNLDFRHRAAAGLGVQFVKENQEALMRSAWNQLQKVRETNKSLNLGRFGRALSGRMHRRVSTLNGENLFKLAMPLQNKIAADAETGERSLTSFPNTIGKLFRQSAVSNTLGQVKIKKYLNPKPSRATAQEGATTTTTAVYTAMNSQQLISSIFTLHGMASSPSSELNVQLDNESGESTHQMNNWGQQIKTALAPQNTIQKNLKARVERIRSWEKHPPNPNSEIGERNLDNLNDPLRPVIWYPEFHQPVYRFLRDLSQEYILPGLDNIPPNTVGVLETNRRFIEAFMIGLNHEMASELRWREFPTDMRGSYFRSFWDTTIYSVDDHEKATFWTTRWGQNLLRHIQQKYGHLLDENGIPLFDTPEKIEKTYTIGDPSEVEQAIAMAYETAIEKWLLTREEDKDIADPVLWEADSRLGSHPIPNNVAGEEEDTTKSELVIVIRGELLQKFPNALIYLIEKTADVPDFSLPEKRVFPIFEGALPPDMVFMGFPIAGEDAEQYFVVFEERITDLRFGLDATDTGGTTANDLSWEHFEIADGGYLNNGQPRILAERWNSAAFIGRAMVQKQVRVAMELEPLVKAASES